MGDLSAETRPGARASGLSLLLLLTLLLERWSGFCSPRWTDPFCWSCGCSRGRGKMCVEDKGKGEKGHVESDLENWPSLQGMGRYQGKGQQAGFAPRDCPEMCSVFWVWHRKRQQSWSVPRPSWDGRGNTCLVSLRRLSIAKTGKHDPREISTRVFLHSWVEQPLLSFEQSCDNHLREHWAVPDQAS